MSEQKEKSPVLDPTLDCEDDRFDPLKCLYSDSVKIPVPDAKCFDNVSVLEFAFKRLGDSVPVGKAVSDSIEAAKQRTKDMTDEQIRNRELNERRFDKYNLEPIKRRDFEPEKNFLQRMKSYDGPLGCLTSCITGRIRVKVVTRYHNRIRGTLIGFLVAFDKMWNLALSDVLESWTKKVPGKCKIPSGFEGKRVANGSVSKKTIVPAVTVKKTENKMQHCERHIPQIMIRGEHVVIIVILK